MMVIGGGVRGGKVYGRWPDSVDKRYDGRDLAVTTDFRDVFGEVITNWACAMRVRCPGYAISDAPSRPVC